MTERRRVLIVEDDPVNRALLAELLIDEGYQPQVASCGVDALALLRRERPDAIVLDLLLPDMDGWEVLRRRWKMVHLRQVPVIVLSALQETHLPPDVQGSIRVFGKPFELEELLGALGHLTAAPAAGSLVPVEDA